MAKCSRSATRSGFTLLELILALALSVLVVGIITSLVEMYASNFKTRGEDIRRVALARSILNMIADDLRSTVVKQEFDTSVLQSMMMGQGGGQGAGGQGGGGQGGGGQGGAGGGQGGQSGGQSGGQGNAGQGGGTNQPGFGGMAGNNQAGGAGGGGAGGGGAGGNRGGLGGGGAFGSTTSSGATSGNAQNSSGQSGQTGNQAGTDPSATGAEGQTTTVSLPLGLTGTATTLNVDVSRLPRPDEYYAQQTSLAAGNLTDVPGDIKSVYYYVQMPTNMGVGDSMNTVTSTPDQTGMVGGLVRRSLDRTVLTNAEELGQIDLINRTGELIAPEVLSLDFMYYDGTQWLTTWDSSTQGMPWLVEISLAMQSKSGEKNGIVSPGISLTTMTLEDRALYGIEVYTLTVAIPGAQLQTTGAQSGTGTDGSTDSGLESVGL